MPSEAAEAPKGEAMIDFTRRIPVRHEVDVFVAGGGPAGIAAAVAAARQGRKVFLAERHTCLGGMGTAGMVPAFMQFTDGANFLAGGIGHEVAEKSATASGFPLRDCLPIKAEVLKRLYDQLLVEAGVDFTFETMLIGVEKDAPDRVGHAVLAAKSGTFAVKAKVFVDATGDGDLAAWAGAPFEKGDKDGGLMPGTLCSLWANVDWPAVRKSGLGAGESRLEAAFKDKVFTIPDRHLPGMWQVGDDIGGGNIGHTFGVDNTDERSVTRALIWGRKALLEYERYYKEYLKGFEKMTLVATGSLLGIRESRRILGDYVLCLDDFKKRAVFPDEIGRYCYPVDIHAFPSKVPVASSPPQLLRLLLAGATGARRDSSPQKTGAFLTAHRYSMGTLAIRTLPRPSPPICITSFPLGGDTDRRCRTQRPLRATEKARTALATDCADGPLRGQSLFAAAANSCFRRSTISSTASAPGRPGSSSIAARNGAATMLCSSSVSPTAGIATR